MAAKIQKPTVIKQRERVAVDCTQGESVEINVMFLAPDGIMPWPDLASYAARMELREYPDDPAPLAVLTSADGNISLSDSGLIVGEIPKEVTFSIGRRDITRFGSDLFIYPADGDGIHVCGHDFKMSLSSTWLEEG